MSDVVTARVGRIRGTTVADGVRSFLGVPYAAPPVGELRWRPAQPLSAWSGVREATRYGAGARQAQLPPNSIYTSAGELHVDEDCLYLNMWTGDAGASGRPVMVWLHPGAYQFGSGNSPLYDGVALAREGITLVTVNHRLGRFGFLAHPWLSEESGHGASGNYGLTDVVAALRWVRENIEQFGGDPGNVTVFGASAGGNSVHNLRAMPSAAGLVHRAIAQSAPGIGPVLNGPGHALGPSTLRAGEQAGSELTDLLGVRSLAELRHLPAEAIESVMLPRAAGDWRFRALPGAGVSTHVFDSGYPVVDGHVLPESPLEVYRGGRQLDIPCILGNSGNESCPLPYLTSLIDYRKFLADEFGAFADEAFAWYPASTDADVARASSTLDADRTFVWSNRTAANLLPRTGSAPVWHYWFDRSPEIPRAEGYIEGNRVGAFHLVEIPYIFRTLDAPSRENWPWSVADRELSRRISSAWVNFARTGNPNGEAAPDWPTHDAARPSTLVWDVDPYVSDPLDQGRMEFLDRFNAAWDGTPGSVATPVAGAL